MNQTCLAQTKKVEQKKSEVMVIEAEGQQDAKKVEGKSEVTNKIIKESELTSMIEEP
jgi:hypothetical protein